MMGSNLPPSLLAIKGYLSLDPIRSERSDTFILQDILVLVKAIGFYAFIILFADYLSVIYHHDADQRNV